MILFRDKRLYTRARIQYEYLVSEFVRENYGLCDMDIFFVFLRSNARRQGTSYVEHNLL